MTAQRVADITIEEFRAIIAQVVDERLRQEQQRQRPKDTRSVQEVLAAMDRIRWTPPPGTPSAAEELIFERRMREIPMPSIDRGEDRSS